MGLTIPSNETVDGIDINHKDDRKSTTNRDQVSKYTSTSSNRGEQIIFKLCLAHADTRIPKTCWKQASIYEENLAASLIVETTREKERERMTQRERGITSAASREDGRRSRSTSGIGWSLRSKQQLHGGLPLRATCAPRFPLNHASSFRGGKRRVGAHLVRHRVRARYRIAPSRARKPVKRGKAVYIIRDASA